MSVKKIDITKEHCPMTCVKTRIELDKLLPGDRLEVLLTEGEPLEMVPKQATEQGFKVVETSPAGGKKHRVIIEK